MVLEKTIFYKSFLFTFSSGFHFVKCIRIVCIILIDIIIKNNYVSVVSSRWMRESAAFLLLLMDWSAVCDCGIHGRIH